MIINKFKKKYTTNKRNLEMVKKNTKLGLFALLVVIILGIALTVYFGTQKTQTKTELPEDLGPQIKVDSLSAKYNPSSEEEVVVEGYTIEGYAAEGNINYTALSKSVDISINWFNQAGFQNINELVIKRYVDNNIKSSKTLKKATANESKYFESFSDILTYTFEGKDVNYNVLGMNKIKIFYKNASNQEVELTPTNLSGVQINPEDLAQTKELLAPVEVEYKPTASGEITVSPDINRKGYFMYPGGSNLSIQEYVIEGTPHAKVYLVPSGTKNTTVKIKLEDNRFIKYANNVFSLDQNAGTEFTLVKGEIDGTLRLKIGDAFAAVKDGKLVMLEMDDITTKQIYNTLDISVTETAEEIMHGHWTIADGEAKTTGQSKVVWEGADGKHNFIKNGKTNQWESQTVKAGDTGIFLYTNTGGLTKNDVIRNIRKSDGTPNRTNLSYNWCIRKPGTSGTASVLKNTYVGAGSWTGSTEFNLCDND
tara:strand:- start:105 stop:1544 length:1440 start_codon:yes stop_codon:yes gene_type:complete